MSNIYLVIIEKNWRYQNFHFPSLKNSPPGHFLLQLKHRGEVWKQKRVWLSYYFNFERNYDFFKSKCRCFFLNKKPNFNKNETEPKMENFKHTFREMDLVLQLW